MTRRTGEKTGRRRTLDRVISRAGAGSRTDARRWIAAGRVRVNGRITRNPEEWVDPEHDRVAVDGRRLDPAERVYVLLYKPKGYVTTRRDPEGRPTVYGLIAGAGFVGTVGRLDQDTSGLLLLTNDTELADRVTSPDDHVEKEYLVKAATVLSDEQLERLREGVMLDDGPARPVRVERARDAGRHTFLTLTLTEGRNRQVRRMIEAVGSRVLKLVRTRIGPVTIGDLAIGRWRMLEAEEVRELRRLAGLHGDTKSERKLPVRARDRAVLGGRGGRGRL